jgi:hypothetical protein
MFSIFSAQLSFYSYFSVSIFCGIGLPGFTVSIIAGASGILALLLGIAVIDSVKKGRV